MIRPMSKNPFLAMDRRILADSGISGEAAGNLFTLCDRIGPRFAGTEGYRRAAEFMLGRFRAYQLANAELEPFEFTAWRRGAPARLDMTAPAVRPYECYALPYGAATGPAGVSAELLDIGVGFREDMEAHRKKIKGRLVLASSAGAHRMDTYRRCAALGAKPLTG